jgi:predicted lactoylglutathione lyase
MKMNQKKRPLFDHVVLHVKDIDQSKRFYRAIVETLGHTITSEAPDVFYIDELEVRQDLHVTRSAHLAFIAENPWSVKLFHDTALKAGGISIGNPREANAPGVYTAHVMDPDGNYIEAIFKRNQKNISISY